MESLRKPLGSSQQASRANWQIRWQRQNRPNRQRNSLCHLLLASLWMASQKKSANRFTDPGYALPDLNIVPESKPWCSTFLGIWNSYCYCRSFRGEFAKLFQKWAQYGLWSLLWSWSRKCSTILQALHHLISEQKLLKRRARPFQRAVKGTVSDLRSVNHLSPKYTDSIMSLL